MKKIIILLIVFASVNVLFTACEKDFLDTYPTDQVSSSTAVLTTGNAMSALNGIHRALYIRYNSTQDLGGVGFWNLSLDEMGEDHVYNRATWTNQYRWLIASSPTNSYNSANWTMFYRLIANANVLINGIDGAEGEQSEKDIIKGQALLYRAYCHFQLVQAWANRYVPGGNNSQLGVPIKVDNSTDAIARSTVEEVYTQINDDLDVAIPLLQGYTRVNKSHLNANVGKGLKARVALVQGNWDIAAQFAAEARQGHNLMDKATYAKGFSTASDQTSEFMWASGIQEDQTNYFGNLGAYLSRNYSSTTIRTNPRSISSKLYNLISPTDVRKTLFDPTGAHLNLPAGVSLLSTFAKFPYTSQKFIAVSNADSRMDIPMMRAAEMYLIEAEAKARKGGQDGLAAQALFDLVKTRDDSYTLSTNTGTALIDEIMLQRRIELWGEGPRFFDMKRLGLSLDRTGANHTSTITGGVMEISSTDNRWTWPIPQAEMDSNPLMEQNPI